LNLGRREVPPFTSFAFVHENSGCEDRVAHCGRELRDAGGRVGVELGDRCAGTPMGKLTAARPALTAAMNGWEIIASMSG
jgi:hypothetical protein